MSVFAEVLPGETVPAAPASVFRLFDDGVDAIVRR
jgi:hypothetical protein